MNIYILMQQRFKQIQLQVICFLLFMLPASIILATGIMTKKFLPWLSHAILFSVGWLTWTFLEYIAHRFWMHNKPAQREKPAISNHLYHHTHPTELKVGNTDRFLLLLSGILIIIVAIFLQNYFTLFAGFYLGFLSYTFMHVILHRKWVNTPFPRLLQNHILHHCKFTNKCFGVTVIWWDIIFGTKAPRNYQISEKVISYYFGDPPEKKK
jgi:sterol desaturase/sphingolipid hydroxylase (fatty acid hydroxylase superfamily)